ncbi:DUF4198 domain-containing protein [Sphingopyxis kveilinensis]|uniref:DUF4198 domain-containing protein n=1 Tax=Sphingopyxis kveilinensis TaxID=3114367 RepID=UPI0030CA75C2
MIRLTLAFAVGTLGAGTAIAHDFWVQPSQWRVAPLDTVTLTLMVGHGADRQPSRLPASRIVRFETIAPDGRRTDLKAPIADSDGQQTRLQPEGDGAHMIVLQSDARAQSRLPPARFESYLKEEGLTVALDARKRTRRSATDGSENYRRNAKAIVLVGTPTRANSRWIEKRVGLALEIVPDDDLFLSPGPTEMSLRIFYHGRPLAGALVKLTDLNNDTKPVAQRRSAADGRVRFAMPGTGTWRANVVWTRPNEPGAATDFETDFSSLSFAVPHRG